MLPRLALRLLIAAVLVGGLSACDSGGDDPEPADVAGVYNVSTLTFDPDIGILGDVSVLDTLDAGQTSLEILDSGQVLFRYRLQGTGSTSQLLTGEASVRNEQVRITFGDGTDTARRRLLLPNQITFDRDGSSLSAETQTTVDLSRYSPRFEDRDRTFSSVRGTLRLTLTPRG